MSDKNDKNKKKKDTTHDNRYSDPYSSKLKYNLDEVEEMMLKALERYRENRTIVSYWRVLNNEGLSRSYLKNWIEQKRFPQLLEIMVEFREIQQERIIENALNGEFNSGFAKFLLEAHYGMMTEYQRNKIEQNQQQLNLEGSIRIGFAEVEEPKDDDIQLLDILPEDDE